MHVDPKITSEGVSPRRIQLVRDAKIGDSNPTKERKVAVYFLSI